MRNLTKSSVAAAAILAVTLTGCSTKAEESSGADTGSVKTDFGVTDDEITLLQLADLSGVFKIISLAFVNGTKLWQEEINAAGGICGRDIAFNVQDTGYKVDNAIPQYDGQKDNAVGMINLGGSHILAALKAKIVADNMVTIAATWASPNLSEKQIGMVGQTYDVEMLNGWAYLADTGKIQDGDTVGHIYIDSEYGQNGYLGTQAYAKEHNLSVIPAAISSTDADMTATITKFKAEGVKAIALTVTPAATGSTAVQNVQQGLNVPLIGSNPTFSPTLLTDPGVEAALSQYSLVSSTVAFDSGNSKADELLETSKKTSQDEPNIGLLQGYTWGLAYQAILEQACEDGDLTRAGLVAAKEQISSVDTFKLTGELDFSKPGTPSSKEAYILGVDKSKPGGLKVVEELFESEDAKNYKTGYEK